MAEYERLAVAVFFFLNQHLTATIRAILRPVNPAVA